MAQQRYFYGTGRRKTAVARVRLVPGTGQNFIVDGRPLVERFPMEGHRQVMTGPLRAAGATGRFDVSVKVMGGGVSGQVGAIQHGIARALLAMDESLRSTLRHAGFLTRDSRMKERKKYGLRRARKRQQYTKR